MVKKVTFTEYPYNNLRSRFGHNFTDLGFDLLNRYYTYRYYYINHVYNIELSNEKISTFHKAKKKKFKIEM